MRGIATGGSRGPAGANGVGVPVGGTSGQVLAKNSNTDFDTTWVDQTSSTGVSTAYIGEQIYRKVVAAGGQANFDISGIPGGYDTIKVYLQGKSEVAGTGDHVLIAFNGDTTNTNYRYASSYTNGIDVPGAAGGDSRQIGTIGGASSAPSAGQIEMTLINPSATTEKVIASFAPVAYLTSQAYIQVQSLHWENTAAINRITLTTNSGADFAEGTLCTVVGYKTRAMSQSEVPDTVQGRLTLTAGLPVTVANITAATTLYYTPYKGNKIHLYDNGSWVLHTFTETSVSLAGLAANTNFDVFAYSNSGTLALELLAWSNDTTRATELALQDGIYVKTGDATRRYLGSIRTTGTIGQCEEGVLRRFVWNYYNQMSRVLSKDIAVSHVYGTTTFRPWNNDTNNKVEFIIGLKEETLSLEIFGHTSSNINAFTTVGVNSSNGNVSNTLLVCALGIRQSSSVNINGNFYQLGYNYAMILEYANGNTTFEQAILTVTLKG